MKKIYLIFIIILFLAIILIIVFRLEEDSWIKDERGVWIKHGNPSEIPDYVLQQQQIIKCALQLYTQEKNNGIEFSSQCLGLCEDYAIDIVNVPRNEEDYKIENQCEDYKIGRVNHFIEINKEGDIARII